MATQSSKFAPDAAAHPRPGLLSALDEWIRRDLQAIFGDTVHEPLPAELHEILRAAGQGRPPGHSREQPGNSGP